MNIGCFALVQPFSGMDRQFQLIRESGFDGPTTLEVAGPDNMKKSAERLLAWSRR